MNRIQEILQNKGIRRTWLAEKIGVTAAMVGAYCRNESQPNLPMADKIASVLGVTINELIKDE